nr:MAG: RNA-dependent RNA polymerase [Riboviria sp.]
MSYSTVHSNMETFTHRMLGQVLVQPLIRLKTQFASKSVDIKYRSRIILNDWIPSWKKLAITALMMAGAYKLVLQPIISSFFPPIPGIFQARKDSKKPQGGKDVAGQEDVGGNFSRHKKDARVAKEGVVFGRDDHDRAKPKGRKASKKNSDEAEFNSMTSTTTEVTVLNNCWTLEVKTRNGYISYVQGMFMDSTWCATTAHAILPYEDDDEITEIGFYPDHPDSGCKTAVIVPRTNFTLYRPDETRDLIYIIFNKVFLPGMKKKWNMVPSRSNAPKHVSNVTKLMFGVVNGQTMFVSQGPFDAYYTETSKLSFFVDTAYGVYRGRGYTYYLVKDAKGESGDCGFPYLVKASPYPILGLHDARYGNDSIVVPIFSDDKFGNEVKESPKANFQSLPPGLQAHVTMPEQAPFVPGAKVIGKIDGLKTSSSVPDLQQKTYCTGLKKTFSNHQSYQ